MYRLYNASSRTSLIKLYSFPPLHSLTDETIRTNWEKYGHPDGRQEVSMGIALPQWIIEGKNNIWVLGVYGIIFGGALPIFVVRHTSNHPLNNPPHTFCSQGRWWFGSREKTKDGVNQKSAAAYFKSMREESSMEEVVGTMSKAYEWESPTNVKSDSDIDVLEKQIEEKAGKKWTEVRKVIGDQVARRRALVLIYAHLLRIPLSKATLQQGALSKLIMHPGPLLIEVIFAEQAKILLQTPLLLHALLTITTSRNWLTPTIAVMRLHAYLTQALLPGAEELRFAQLPGIKEDESKTLAPKAKDVGDFVHALEEKQDGRLADVKKAVSKWGRLECVEASFKGRQISSALCLQWSDSDDS